MTAHPLTNVHPGAYALSEQAIVGLTYGSVYYVHTSAGSASNDGRSWNSPFSTMALALAAVSDNGRIYVIGDVREEVLTPLGVQGVQIIGGAGGNTRHDDGVRWREPASGATSGGALLTIREQGWEVHNILFVPKSDGTAVRLRRAEDATYPDGSHTKIVGCKFIGAATATTKGIEDMGGTHHQVIEACEFHTLSSAIVNTSTSIANPLRWTVQDCIFTDNTEHIDMPFTESIVRRNVFDEATTNVELDGGAGGNFCVDNYFQQDQANIAIADGYKSTAGDMWRNYSQNTAATTVGVPS